jgi:hypothetical protein
MPRGKNYTAARRNLLKLGDALEGTLKIKAFLFPFDASKGKR